MLFYFDEIVNEYETHFQWDRSLRYLEDLYAENPQPSILSTLIGCSWFYLVEGPIISREYGNDENILPLEYWKKYIDIGMVPAYQDPYLAFISGYTLSLDGEVYLGPKYEHQGYLLMKRCAEIADDPCLKELAINFIQNTRSREHVPISNSNTICSKLFCDESLIDQYFREIYRT